MLLFRRPKTLRLNLLPSKGVIGSSSSKCPGSRNVTVTRNTDNTKQSKQRASNLQRDQLTFFSLAIVAWISKYLFNVSRYGPLPWNCKRRLWGSHLNFTYSPFLLHLYWVHYDRIKWPSPVGSVAHLDRRCTMQYHRDQDANPEKPEFSQVFFSHLLNGRL